jgi:hypothetical protein
MTMNDRDIERVLKSAGLRDKPPAHVERAVREQLRGQWRDVVADRRRRGRQRVAYALAAGFVAAVVGTHPPAGLRLRARRPARALGAAPRLRVSAHICDHLSRFGYKVSTYLPYPRDRVKSGQ